MKAHLFSRNKKISSPPVLNYQHLCGVLDRCSLSSRHVDKPARGLDQSAEQKEELSTEESLIQNTYKTLNYNEFGLDHI